MKGLMSLEYSGIKRYIWILTRLFKCNRSSKVRRTQAKWKTFQFHTWCVLKYLFPYPTRALEKTVTHRCTSPQITGCAINGTICTTPEPKLYLQRLLRNMARMQRFHSLNVPWFHVGIKKLELAIIKSASAAVGREVQWNIWSKDGRQAIWK